MGRGVRAARTLAMLRAERIERIGHWPRELARGTVTLAYDDRHRRRLRLMSDAGEPFLLDLSRTAILEEGDGLALSDGTWLAVNAAPYRLMTWLSPAYPLGAFSYSHGLEYAIEAGLVADRDSLQAWVATAVGAGAGRSDAALLVAAWRAVRADDRAALDEVVALAAAWRGTAETALESRAQGVAFLATTRTAWPHVLLDEIALQHRGELALPVAVGVAAAAQEVPLPAVLTAYLHGFTGNLVSAARSARGRPR